MSEINDFPLWIELLARYNAASNTVHLDRDCMWSSLRKSNFDQFQIAVSNSAEYAVFFIRALIGDKEFELVWKSNKISVSKSLIEHGLSSIGRPELGGADLVARSALILAWDVCQRKEYQNYLPCLETLKLNHPDAKAQNGRLRFVGADFVMARKPKLTTFPISKNETSDYYNYGWDGPNPPTDGTWNFHGWRLPSDRRFFNNPTVTRGSRSKAIESFMGFPAFFRDEVCNVAFVCDSNRKRNIDFFNMTHGHIDLSHKYLVNLGIKPYISHKQREFIARQKENADLIGTLVVCLGVTNYPTAAFSASAVKGAYGIFISVDIEIAKQQKQASRSDNYPTDYDRLSTALDAANRSKQRLRFITLQVLVSDLAEIASSRLWELKRSNEILNMIQEPMRSLTDSLLSAQHLTQRINAVAHAPAVSLFSVAPLVQKYFVLGKKVTFGFSWTCIHSDGEFDKSKLTNTICAVVLTSLGVSSRGITDTKDLYSKTMKEVEKMSPHESTPEGDLRALFRKLGVQSNLLIRTDALQDAFRHVKQIVFTPFKPEAATWPLLPLLVAIGEYDWLRLSVCVSRHDKNISVGSLTEFLDVESLGEFVENKERPYESTFADLLRPLRKFSNSNVPRMPIAIFSHLLDFVHGLVQVLQPIAVIVTLSIPEKTSTIKLELITTEREPGIKLADFSEILAKMEIAMKHKLGAGLRGDFQSPFFDLAERITRYSDIKNVVRQLNSISIPTDESRLLITATESSLEISLNLLEWRSEST